MEQFFNVKYKITFPFYENPQHKTINNLYFMRLAEMDQIIMSEPGRLSLHAHEQHHKIKLKLVEFSKRPFVNTILLELADLWIKRWQK